MSTKNNRTANEARREEVRGDRVAQLRRMHEIRILEDRVLELFAEGLVHGSTHTCQGQEAVAVGLAAAARVTDNVTCTYRGHGVGLALGMSPESVLGEILGRICGCVGGLGGSMHMCEPDVGLLPTFAIVGGGLPVAVGAALTAQMRGLGNAALTVFGDGSTNIGAFHESMNLAAIWQLPLVFICENNLYGEYSPIATTTPVLDLAVRAASYAMPAEIVDGQDIDLVRASVDRALERARAGEGPTFLEMRTYRYAGHSRSDPGAYRPEGELARWMARDPLVLFEAKLVGERLLTEETAGALRETARQRIEQAIAEVLDSPEPSVEDMFRNVFA